MMIGYARAEPGPDAPASVARQRGILHAAGAECVFAEIGDAFPNDGESVAAAVNALAPGDTLAACEPETITASAAQWAELTEMLDRRGADILILEYGVSTAGADGRHMLTTIIAAENWKHDKRHPGGDGAERERLLAWLRLISPSAAPDEVSEIAELVRRQEEAAVQIPRLVAEHPSVGPHLQRALASFDAKIGEVLAARGRRLSRLPVRR